MKVGEEQRRALFEQVSAHLDEEAARLLLEVTVPANVELATRGDIQELRTEMPLPFTVLDGRLTGQIAGMGKDLTDQLSRRVLPNIGIMLSIATLLSRVTTG